MKTKIEFIVNLIVNTTLLIATSILIYGIYTLITDMIGKA